MLNLSITIYICCASFFMFINKNLRETAFNYCAQWSGISDQKIDFYYLNGRHLSHYIKASTRRNGFHKKECTHPTYFGASMLWPCILSRLTSHGILHYLWTANISKSFSKLNIYQYLSFLNTSFNKLCQVEKWRITLHCLCRDSLTLKASIRTLVNW